MQISPELQIQGFYKLQIGNAETGEIRETLEFSNLITNIGLNAIGTTAPINRCFVGSGNATPAFTDTKLSVFVAATVTLQSTIETKATAAPLWAGRAVTYRFAAGAAAGNLSEIGMGWDGSTASTHLLFSRALIKDGAGNPTTITVLANEFLDVTYEVRVYLPTDDVVFDGVVVYGNPHKLTVRGFQQASGSQAGFVFNGWGAHTASAYANFVLQAATASTAAGSLVGSAGGAAIGYTEGSLKRGWVATYSLTVGNNANGISGFALTSASGSNTVPAFQILVEPPIMKDSTKTLNLTCSWRWARKV